jgi:signal transduction histidine kinase
LLRATFPSSVNFQLDLDDVPQVMCNAVQLQQVIMNLCLNARYALEDSGELSVSLVHERGEHVCTSCSAHAVGDFFMLGIHDNGAGILPDDLPRIFDPFFTTQALGQGSGVGLSMIHGIVHSTVDTSAWRALLAVVPRSMSFCRLRLT